MDQNKGRQEETPHPTHMFRRLFLDLLLTERAGCASAMGVMDSLPAVLVPKTLCNQFIYYYICSRAAFGIYGFKLRNFAVVAIIIFATVNTVSKMTRILRWSMMTCGTSETEFMDTKHNGHIHRYETHTFGNIVINVSKPINNNSPILWRLWHIVRFDMPRTFLLLLHS